MELSLIFAQNLRRARQRIGYTQKQLGEQLGYSEKAISKWERGNAIPPVVELVRLCKVLCVSIGELLEGESEAKYFLGIDGGGTKTSFLLEDSKGEIVASHKLGSSNPNDIGMEACLQLLKKGIADVCAGIEYRDIAVFAGIAGGGISGDNVVHIAEMLSKMGFAYVSNGSDVENALELALHGGEGVAIIAGTGSIAFAQDKNGRRRVGGWGYLLDGAGSGYDIARAALAASFRMIDGRGEKTLLLQLLEQELKHPLPDAIPSIYAGGKRFIASFAPLVFRAAEKGDAVAERILKENAAYLRELVETAHSLLENKSAPVVITGGLARQRQILEPLIREGLSKEIDLRFMEEEMVKGAVDCARRKYYEQHGKA